MARDDKELLLIIRHFNTPEDATLAAQVQGWREQDARNESYYQELYRLWTASAGAKALDGIDVDAAVARLSEKIGLDPFEETRVLRMRSRRHMLQWAAGIAALFVTIFVIYRLYHKEVVQQITRNTLSSKDSLLLADGSKIYLDAYSSITYPERFDTGSRTVSFQKGTAFFKIADDQARPFTIVMDHTAIKVLGTSFNIRKAGRQINVDVKSGRIMFLVNEKTRAILSAGTAGSYDLSADSIRTFSNQNQNSDAWLTGELHFIDEPLSKVFEKLEAHYHVQIDLDTNLAKLGKFNATFTNNNLDEVITLLERTYPIVIVKKGNKLMVRNK